MGSKESDGTFVGGEDGSTGPTGHSFNMDVVAVKIIEDEQVSIAMSRRTKETAGLVGEDSAADRFAHSIEIH